MIDEYNHLIESFRYKLRKLVSLYDQQKSEKIVLEKTNVELQNKIEEKDTEINTLKEELSKLKLAKSIVGEEENSHEAKQQINKLVREIDKCIALLNR